MYQSGCAIDFLVHASANSRKRCCVGLKPHGGFACKTIAAALSMVSTFVFVKVSLLCRFVGAMLVLYVEPVLLALRFFILVDLAIVCLVPSSSLSVVESALQISAAL